ncbi:hypothetical protein E2C01_035349 [Portunus trituberculatus]|uniref:Uncharacterized protein n=1 Tax=Portunus trituberculatus TaxID=210409 RepID=A0A5B7F8Y5_PORTR|nr:hypothetical protein [Portunus trituberculatus]
MSKALEEVVAHIDAASSFGTKMTRE